MKGHHDERATDAGGVGGTGVRAEASIHRESRVRIGDTHGRVVLDPSRVDRSNTRSPWFQLYADGTTRFLGEPVDDDVVEGLIGRLGTRQRSQK